MLYMYSPTIVFFFTFCHILYYCFVSLIVNILQSALLLFSISTCSRCLPVVTVGAEKRDWLIEPCGYTYRDLLVIIFSIVSCESYTYQGMVDKSECGKQLIFSSLTSRFILSKKDPTLSSVVSSSQWWCFYQRCSFYPPNSIVSIPPIVLFLSSQWCIFYQRCSFYPPNSVVSILPIVLFLSS